MKTPTPILTALVLAITPVLADNDHSHDASGGHSHGAKVHGEVAIPATLPDLWAAIQKQQTDLVSALEKKDGTAGHNIAETLIAYSNDLPGKVEGLDESQIKRITGQAKNLAKVYGDIHHAAFDKAVKEANKAASVLKLLQPQLPLEN